MTHIYGRPTIAAEAAERIVRAAEAKARDIAVPMSIAVVDESGILKAFSRMDGASPPSVQIAQDKAYTAAGFGIPTDGWYDQIKDDPPLAIGGPTGIDRFIIFGGGYPLKSGESIVGAIGVSGGRATQDMQVAQEGLSAFEH